MNDLEKGAALKFVSQLAEAFKLIRDMAIKLWQAIKEYFDNAVSFVTDTAKKQLRYIRIPSHAERTFRQSSGSHIDNSLKIERSHQTDQRHPALRRIGGIRHGKR